MAYKVHEIMIHLLELTFGEALWSLIPLLIATVVMTFYFEKYKNERPGWNTYTANSLVLIFVSLSLFRYIHGLSPDGSMNFVIYSWKSLASLALFMMGFAILRFNFTHTLPEKVAHYLSAPITLSIVAYIVILYVHTPIENSLRLFVSLLVILSVALLLFALLKIPAYRFFEKMKKMKEKEKMDNLKLEKTEIKKLKEDLKNREKQLKKYTLKEIEDQKKQALKLKKEARKPS